MNTILVVAQNGSSTSSWNLKVLVYEGNKEGNRDDIGGKGTSAMRALRVSLRLRWQVPHISPQIRQILGAIFVFFFLTCYLYHPHLDGKFKWKLK